MAEDAKVEEPPGVNRVRVNADGPLDFEGDLTVGTEPMPRATLCRCGASKEKPFCDDSHLAVGFEATGEPAEVAREPMADLGGSLAVLPQPNGPLKIVGNLEIVSDSGRTIATTTKVFLCRCGGSAHKPYCDGTHKKIGFVAP